MLYLQFSINNQQLLLIKKITCYVNVLFPYAKEKHVKS